jgi:hypothetical protein
MNCGASWGENETWARGSNLVAQKAASENWAMVIPQHLARRLMMLYNKKASWKETKASRDVQGPARNTIVQYPMLRDTKQCVNKSSWYGVVGKKQRFRNFMDNHLEAAQVEIDAFSVSQKERGGSHLQSRVIRSSQVV